MATRWFSVKVSTSELSSKVIRLYSEYSMTIKRWFKQNMFEWHSAGTIISKSLVVKIFCFICVSCFNIEISLVTDLKFYTSDGQNFTCFIATTYLVILCLAFTTRPKLPLSMNSRSLQSFLATSHVSSKFICGINLKLKVMQDFIVIKQGNEHSIVCQIIDQIRCIKAS